MIIKSLEVEGFRNLKKLQLQPEKGLNIIAGDNAMGKTNLIEAIYMLTGARSFRNTRDKNLINFDSDIAKIEGVITKSDYMFKLMVMMDKNPGSYRKGFINGIDSGRAARIAGNFCAVVFSPDHLGLVKGSREGRRYFMDNAICNLYPSYIEELYRYNRVLDHRNKLLKKLRFDNNTHRHDILEVIDIQLAECCEKVALRRKNYINGLAPIASQYYSEIGENRENINICYESRAEASQDYLKLLEENRETDLRLGFTGVGTHRDDMGIILSSLPAANFASQGQQRSIVLSLKHAEAQYYKDITGQKPILLYDDVLSELDGRRQDFLLRDTTPFQTFFTACDLKAFNDISVKVFYMKDGEISQ